MNAVSALMGLVCIFGGDSKGATLRGAVVDAVGKPIAGARVDIATAAPFFGAGLFCPSCYKDCTKGTRSDNAGRFEIGGLDPTLKFTVLISAPNRKAHLTKLIDPAAEEIKITLEALPANHPREQIVLGRLVDDRGQPISGALVSPSGAETTKERWHGSTNIEPAVSDADGRFRLLLPKDYLGVDVTVTAQEFAGAQVLLLKPGPDEHRVMVPAGTRVTGRLVHDGKPMAGLRVAVVQMDRGAGRHFIKAVGAVTDKDGKFAMTRLPANEDYAIFTVAEEGPQKFVITTKKFKAIADRKERDLGDLAVVRPRRIVGGLEIPVGQTLPADTKITLGRNPAWDLIAVNVDKTGQFVIDGLPPETYKVAMRAGGFEIDSKRMRYQTLGELSFGLRLRESIDDLRIPLVSSTKKEIER